MAGNKRKPWINAAQPSPCKHAFKLQDADGKVRWREDDVFSCKFPVPEQPYPNALVNSYGWKEPTTGIYGVNTFKSRCAGCPCYELPQTETP